LHAHPQPPPPNTPTTQGANNEMAMSPEAEAAIQAKWVDMRSNSNGA
jgi:hypothetical protein